MSVSKLEMKQYRTVFLYRSMMHDFMRGKLSVICVESSSNGSYGSPIHKRCISAFKAYANARHYPHNTLGTTRGTSVSRRRHIIDLYLTQEAGRLSHPDNNFDADRIVKCLDGVRSYCVKHNVPMTSIGIQRIFGHKGGVPWQQVVDVLDAWCEANQCSLYAYLPENYDKNYCR